MIWWLEGLHYGRDLAEEFMTLRICIFKDIAWRRRIASRADFLFLRCVLCRVHGGVVERSRTLKQSMRGFAALRPNQLVGHIVRPESAPTIESSRWVGNLLLLLNETLTTAFPGWKIFLCGAFSLKRDIVTFSLRNWPDGTNTFGLIGNIVEMACAV